MKPQPTLEKKTVNSTKKKLKNKKNLRISIHYVLHFHPSKINHRMSQLGKLKKTPNNQRTTKKNSPKSKPSVELNLVQKKKPKTG